MSIIGEFPQRLRHVDRLRSGRRCSSSLSACSRRARRRPLSPLRRRSRPFRPALDHEGADAPKGAGNCDDLGILDGNLFMGCQNKATSSGVGGDSTLVEFSLSGKVINTWPIMHKIDGLAGDPLTHKVIVTLDEDTNTHWRR